MSKKWTVETFCATGNRINAFTGTKAACEGHYSDLAKQEEKHNLAKGMKVQLIEMDGTDAKVLRSFEAHSKEQDAARSITSIDDRLRDYLGACAKEEAEFAERAAKYGMADAIECRSERLFEAEGEHKVWWMLMDEAKDLLATFANISGDDKEAAAIGTAKALSGLFAETRRIVTERLLGCSDWVPTCTNAIYNVRRAFSARGEAKALRSLEWMQATMDNYAK